MAVREILLLGHPDLYKVCEVYQQNELADIQSVVDDLHDTMLDFRARNRVGRAIAAPQIGVLRRLVYMHIEKPIVFINPVLHDMSDEMIELWDDCMSFPDLLVKLKRHQRCKITYLDTEWQEQTMELAGDLSELLQHECDHLDGVLAVSRALDGQSFSFRSQRHFIQDAVVGGN